MRFLFVWTLLAILVGTFAFFKIDTKTALILLVATVLIYLGIGAWVVGNTYFKQQKEKKSIDYLIRKNLVTAVEVSSNKYYELKEQDDEGQYYLFQLSGDKVFSFGGQDFYPSEKFPSDKFEIVEGRGIDNELIFRETYNYGNKIEPTRVIGGQEKWAFLNKPNYPDPTKLTVTTGRIEDYF